MSSKSYLKASIKFLDPSLDGASLAEIARSYRPLLKLHGEYLTSCFFEKIGDGTGTMKLDTPYEVLISLHMRKQMEEFIGKSIQEILPVGRDLEIVTTIDRTVAKGRAEGILEVDAGVDGKPSLD
jgi:hypothetical protein